MKRGIRAPIMALVVVLISALAVVGTASPAHASFSDTTTKLFINGPHDFGTSAVENSTYGESVGFTVEVFGSCVGPFCFSPKGKVKIEDVTNGGAQLLAEAVLHDGSSSLAFAQLSYDVLEPGYTHIRATYLPKAGGAFNSSSVDGPQVLLVGKAPTSPTISQSSTTSLNGEKVRFSAHGPSSRR